MSLEVYILRDKEKASLVTDPLLDENTLVHRELKEQQRGAKKASQQKWKLLALFTIVFGILLIILLPFKRVTSGKQSNVFSASKATIVSDYFTCPSPASDKCKSANWKCCIASNSASDLASNKFTCRPANPMNCQKYPGGSSPPSGGVSPPSGATVLDYSTCPSPASDKCKSANWKCCIASNSASDLASNKFTCRPANPMNCQKYPGGSSPPPGGSSPPPVGTPESVGNCKTGSYPFNQNRFSSEALRNGRIPASVNVNNFDFVYSHGKENIGLNNGVMEMSLRKTGSSGGTVSHTRWIHYGRYSVRMKVPNKGGPVNAFISISPQGDEIDWEITGNPPDPNTNVFWQTTGKTQAQKEYFTHYSTIKNVDMSVSHVYTIDWKKESIVWSIDGQVVRTLLKKDSNSKLNPSGPKWFPTNPSLIMFGVWDASFASNPNTTKWAGGKLDWASETVIKTTFSDLKVECYNDNGESVSKWP